MSLVLSPEAERRLEEWLGMSTWYTGDRADEGWFYRFVRALRECNRELIPESELRDRILAQAMVHGDWDESAAREWTDDRRYANRAQEITDYHLANDD